MIVDQQVAPSQFLAHPVLPVSYEFVPQGDEVVVVHRSLRHTDAYRLPVEKARQLWRDLRNKGYERF